jgi:hypothetical protein
MYRILYSSLFFIRFVEGRILEAAVSGSILAGMCKSAVSIEPELALNFFIPHLCQRIENCLAERMGRANRPDMELQFCTLLLSEVYIIVNDT